MHLTPDPSGGKQLVGYRGHPNARSCEKGCLSRIFFRVRNSFLACPPLTARGYFCGVDPVEAGDLQVDRIKVAVAAGPGMRCSKSGFSALVSCISRFWVCKADELRHALLAWSLWCFVPQEMDVRLWLLAALLGRSRLCEKKQWPDPGRRLEPRITRVRRWLEACRFPWDAGPRPSQEAGVPGSSSCNPGTRRREVRGLMRR